MILCDTNVWLALALPLHSHHEYVKNWLDTVESASSIVICRATQHAFLRLLTTAAVMRPYGNRALTNEQAWETWEALLEDDRIVYQAHEPPGLEARWKRLTSRATASPKLWMDVYLAAFAIAGGSRIVTTDFAFKQFPGLDLLILGAS